VLRDRHRGAVLATVVVIVLAGLWPLALLVALPLVWTLLRRLVRRTAVALPSARRISTVLNVLALMAVVIGVFTVVASDPDRLQPQDRADIGVAAEHAPDIYLVWLDGYPRSDTLRETFDIDNGPFLAGLEERGFTVSRGSRSNYDLTWLTMSSLFHMAYVDSIPQLEQPSDEPIGQFKQLRRAVNAAPAMNRLRAAGYTVVSSQGAFTDAGFSNAEIVLDDGQLNQFEEQLMRLTTLARLVDFVDPDWFAGQARSWIRSSFEHLRVMAERRQPEGPIAMLAHVMAPHPPFVMAPDGPRPAPDCHPARCFLWETHLDDLGMTHADYASRLREYLDVTNGMILDALDRVVAARPDAVVILMSDHGTRYRRDDIREHFQSFFAARTPEHDGLFPQDISPVNVFPILFGAYLGDETSLKPYEAWRWPGARPLELVPYP
jgi:hypothetical protein